MTFVHTAVQWQDGHDKCDHREKWTTTGKGGGQTMTRTVRLESTTEHKTLPSPVLMIKGVLPATRERPLNPKREWK